MLFIYHLHINVSIKLILFFPLHLFTSLHTFYFYCIIYLFIKSFLYNLFYSLSTIHDFLKNWLIYLSIHSIYIQHSRTIVKLTSSAINRPVLEACGVDVILSVQVCTRSCVYVLWCNSTACCSCSIVLFDSSLLNIFSIYYYLTIINRLVFLSFFLLLFFSFYFLFYFLLSLFFEFCFILFINLFRNLNIAWWLTARCSPAFFPCSYTLIGAYVTINNASININQK